MKSPIGYLRYPMLFAFLAALAACSDESFSVSHNRSHSALTVYKSRTCECCELWIQHMEDAGFHAKGLSVPGMPVGSPGMEVGNQFTPYKIWLLKKDGSAEIFAVVDSPDQQ